MQRSVYTAFNGRLSVGTSRDGCSSVDNGADASQRIRQVSRADIRDLDGLELGPIFGENGSKGRDFGTSGSSIKDRSIV
jgi:hypothetical protein